MNANVLEVCILLACERGQSGEWSGTIAALGSALREISATEPPRYDQIAEAVIELDRQGHLEATKCECVGLIPVWSKTPRVTGFFFGADFRLRITHKGRKRLAEPPAPEPAKEPIGFRPA